MLEPGDKFLDITLSRLYGGTISLSSDTEGEWIYLMFYRGGW
jgi:peroxiredoxin